MKTAEYAQQRIGRGGGERRRFQEIARKISATIGAEYFHALAVQLSEALEADCVYVGEFVGGQMERVRTLAACSERAAMESFDFPLAGSPDAQLAVGNPCVYSAGVRDLFPSTDLLARLRAEGCVGVPLNNSDGLPCGDIVALTRRRLGEEIRFVQSMLGLFAPRASAELNRKQGDDAIRESEERHRAFIMLNSDAMWRIEFEKPIATDLPESEQIDSLLRYGYVAECNEAAARFVGRRLDEVIGLRIDEIDPRADQTTVRSSLVSFVRSGYRFDTVDAAPHDAAGNQRCTLRTQWGIVENGVLQRVWGMTRDVTELKRYQMALETSKRRQTELLQAVRLLAVLLDRDESISFCNDFFLKLTGWQADEIRGRDWFELMIPAEERESLRAELHSMGSGRQTVGHHEVTLLTRDGARRLIEWDSVVLRNSKEEFDGVAAIGRDITDQKVLEEQLRQAQKLESIGQLAGGVAHDFNNLLTVIRGYGGLLLEHMQESDPVYFGLVEISKAAEKGAALTRQLLAFSRRKAREPQALNLNAIVEDVERMLRRLIGDHIELTTDLEPALGVVRADAGDMNQVLLNLAVNARDAMPKGGKLIIATSNVYLDKTRASRLAAIPAGPYVQLIVADTGVGMSKEVQAHLFEPFFTTKEVNQGTGLGLSVVYGIVRQSEGYLLVESEPDKGAMFEILLPRVMGAARPAAPPEESNAEILGGTETILLVEDQKELRNLLVTLLRGLGYTVIEAQTPRLALRLIKRHDVPIHLVVADVVLPGMLGPELVKAVKTAHPKTKVLYISGYGETVGAEVPVDEPGTAYLPKSFTARELSAKVREILDRQ